MEHNIPRKKLYNLYIVKDLTMKEVAEVLGVGIGTVHRHIHKEEIPIKETPEHSWNSGKTYKDDDRILAKQKHPRYIDGRTYPSDFKAIRNTILPCPCQECGEDAECLHHIDEDIHNNHMDNLELLCNRCHTILHNKKKVLYKYVRGTGIR